jgi:hypothetical protein
VTTAYLRECVQHVLIETRHALPSGDLTLNSVLALLGYCTHPAPGVCGDLGAKHVMHAGEWPNGEHAGSILFTGNAGDVWTWLRKTRQIF